MPDGLITTSIYAGSFLAMLGVLVFVHEFGHYIVARLCGVYVEVFSLGFGPEIIGWNDQSGTRWKVSIFPLGGYVKMLGENDDDIKTAADSKKNIEEQKKLSFGFKPLSHKAAIVAAGPVANFMFAIVILATLFIYAGRPYSPPEIGIVTEGSAAAAAGLQPGDVFVSLNGQPVDRFEAVQAIVRASPSVPLETTIRRGDQELTLTVTPQPSTAKDHFGHMVVTGLLGVGHTGTRYQKLSPAAAAKAAITETGTVITGTLNAIGQMIAGTRGTEELGGPLRIAQISGDVAQAGFIPFIWLMALMSINLGLINLFPIPLLDGGHLLFYAVEAIRGQPLGERAQEYGMKLGFAVVVSLMIFATWNDLVQLKIVAFVRDLVF